ncbi:MAG: metalloregulator ArsR/SmtB family transcription factor, partial [Deltaproteobacteria bacterium]|nr:metalloregulator ArsR/SmtB family transcription factor [Deltaproteobacteria bacterium]
MKKTAKLFKALSDETRLRILKMLEVRPLCVCEIQHVLKGSQPNVSHHLKTLADAGLVDSKRDGLWIAYRIADTPET